MGACSKAGIASPENGDTTRSPGPRMASGRARLAIAAAADASRRFCQVPDSQPTYGALSGETAEAADIATLAASGDARANRAMDIYESRLARALASIINVLDPDVIVLGGGLSNIARLYAQVPPLLKPFVFSDSADTPTRGRSPRGLQRRSRRGMVVALMRRKTE